MDSPVKLDSVPAVVFVENRTAFRQASPAQTVAHRHNLDLTRYSNPLVLSSGHAEKLVDRGLITAKDKFVTTAGEHSTEGGILEIDALFQGGELDDEEIVADIIQAGANELRLQDFKNITDLFNMELLKAEDEGMVQNVLFTKRADTTALRRLVEDQRFIDTYSDKLDQTELPATEVASGEAFNREDLQSLRQRSTPIEYSALERIKFALDLLEKQEKLLAENAPEIERIIQKLEAQSGASSARTKLENRN